MSLLPESSSLVGALLTAASEGEERREGRRGRERRTRRRACPEGVELRGRASFLEEIREVIPPRFSEPTPGGERVGERVVGEEVGWSMFTTLVLCELMINQNTT